RETPVPIRNRAAPRCGHRPESRSRSMPSALVAAPPRARVLVVTVNYRTPELAVRCLASLAPEFDRSERVSAVVVDNASGDGSPERIRRAIAEHGWSAWARVHESSVNGGFGAGNNLALRESLAGPRPPDYFLLLNPDAAVEPGALGALVAFLDS